MPLATKIRKQLDAVHENNVQAWRGWAHDLAVDGTSPRPLDVLNAAHALGIADPAEALEADAAAYREFLQCDRSAQFCRADAANKAAALGGIDKAYAALRAAEAEVQRLRDAINDLENGCSESFWINARSRIERANTRLFGPWPRKEPALENMEAL